MRIAVLGLGIIGSIWSRHLVADGHCVRTWNRTRKPDFPGFTADLAEAVREAELIQVVVADPPAVHEVIARMAPALAPGAIVAQHATIGVADTTTAAVAVRAAGARFLDLPFTGSKPAAEQRQNVFFVGDDDGSFATVRPIYERLSARCLAIGPVGQAMATKLSFNLLIAGVNQAVAESLAVARRAGISDATWFEGLSLNMARSPYAELKKPKLLNRDWSPQFSVKHMHKDLRLVLALAETLGLSLPTTAATARQYAAAEGAGKAELDMSVLAEVVDPRGAPGDG